MKMMIAESTSVCGGTANALLKFEELHFFPPNSDRVTKYPSAWSIGDRVTFADTKYTGGVQLSDAYIAEVIFSASKVYYTLYIKNVMPDKSYLYSKLTRVDSIQVLPLAVYNMLVDPQKTGV